MDPNSQIIVALDFDNRRAAEEIVDRLGEECRFYKVGLELLTVAGSVQRRALARNRW